MDRIDRINSDKMLPLPEVPVPGMKAKVKYHRGWGDLICSLLS